MPSTSRTFDITQTVTSRISQHQNTVEFSRQQIVILDEAREPYYSAIDGLDSLVYQDIISVNNSIVAVSSAYQERINVGCRTDMFWTQIGYQEYNPGPPAIPQTWTYKCAKISYVGYGTTATLPTTSGIGTTTGDPIPEAYGYETDNLHGLKIYDEPYFEDLLSTYVGSGIGTIGAGSTALYIMAPINSGGIVGLDTGQLVQSSKNFLFSGNINTIVGIATTTRDLSNIPNSGVTTNSSNINVVYLQNPAILSAKAPEDDESFVTFTFLIDPDNISDDFAVPFGTSPYTPQTVQMMTRRRIGSGTSIAYVNNGDPNVSRQWNQFLNGFQDPDDLRPNRTVSPPRVGAGITHYRVGFSSAPAIYVGGSFDRFAIEDEEITTIAPLGSILSNVGYEPLSSCPTQESSLTNAISNRDTIESNFSSGISTFTSRINLLNALRDDLKDYNLRIWAYRCQIGEANRSMGRLNQFSSLINQPDNRILIDTVVGIGTQ